MLWSLSTRILGCLALATSLLASTASAQLPPPPSHPQYHLGASSPPGYIGQQELLRGGPRPGYFQPVEIKAPEGAGIAMVEEGRFGEPQETRALVGLQMGFAYQLKVTNIPLNEGVELFPTIEIVDRLYPPQGQELRFPIPIELTLEELDHAAAGRYVTRVIYLEDPRQALGAASDPDRQRYYEVPNSIDPLTVADRAGRPMAILRIGSRVISDEDLDAGKVRMGPFVKFKFPAASKTQQPFIVPMPADKDIPASDYHPSVPREDPDQRWAIMPTLLVPQHLPPPAQQTAKMPRNVRR